MNNHNSKLKSEIKEMLKVLGISNTYFRNTLHTIAYRKYNNSRKRVPLAQQHSFLKEMLLADKSMRKNMDEQKESIKKDQETKSAMMGISNKQLENTVKGIFSNKM